MVQRKRDVKYAGFSQKCNHSEDLDDAWHETFGLTVQKVHKIWLSRGLKMQVRETAVQASESRDKRLARGKKRKYGTRGSGKFILRAVSWAWSKESECSKASQPHRQNSIWLPSCYWNGIRSCLLCRACSFPLTKGLSRWLTISSKAKYRKKKRSEGCYTTYRARWAIFETSCLRAQLCPQNKHLRTRLDYGKWKMMILVGIGWLKRDT